MIRFENLDAIFFILDNTTCLPCCNIVQHLAFRSQVLIREKETDHRAFNAWDNCDPLCEKIYDISTLSPLIYSQSANKHGVIQLQSFRYCIRACTLIYYIPYAMCILRSSEYMYILQINYRDTKHKRQKRKQFN